MSAFQTYIGSAYASNPVRWIESTEAARSRSVPEKLAEKPVEKAADPDAGKPQSASGDVLDISSDAQKVLEAKESDSQTALEKSDAKSDASAEKSEKAELESSKEPPTGEELTPEEQQQVEELKARDREVRIHEMAHVMAGGAFVTSGPSYTYQTGPDGKGYAIGGSVGIDTSPVEGDPQATIQKMQTVMSAALAPAEPSGQDMKVAAAARQAVAKAQAELSQQPAEQVTEGQESSGLASEGAEDGTGAFSIVRSADKSSAETDSSMKAVEKSAEKTSVWGQTPVSAFAPSSAYKAQSTASLALSRFSAFA